MSVFRGLRDRLRRQPDANEDQLLSRQFDFFVYDFEVQYRNLISTLTKAINRDPTNVNALHNRGTAYDEIGESRAALADFDRAISLSTAPAQTLGRRAMAKANLGDFAGAVDDYTRAIELDPSPGLFARRSRAYQSLGNVELAAADDLRAKNLLAVDPQTQGFLQVAEKMRSRTSSDTHER